MQLPAIILPISIPHTVPSVILPVTAVVITITEAFTANSVISLAAVTAALRQALKYPFRQAETAPVTSAAGIKRSAAVIPAPLKNLMLIGSASRNTVTDTAVLIIMHNLTPYPSIPSGSPFFLPSSSETRRLMQRNALPFERIPARPKNEPVRLSMPIADAPICFVMKTFSRRAAESRKSCIAVSSTVSRTILLFIIIASSRICFYILWGKSSENDKTDSISCPSDVIYHLFL